MAGRPAVPREAFRARPEHREAVILSRFKRVVAIGAHPDDIEYGCGGTLLALGRRVEKSAFVASMGSLGDPSSGPGRVDEATAALQALGVARVHVRKEAGLTAAGFDAVEGTLHRFLQDCRPDLILTHGPHDTHQEHRLVHELTAAAARRSRASVLNYAVLSNTPDFRPHVFVDIAAVFEDKKRILKLHRSQQDKYYMGEEYLEIFHAHQYAALHGVRYCEAFEIVRAFV